MEVRGHKMLQTSLMTSQLGLGLLKTVPFLTEKFLSLDKEGPTLK